MLFISSSLFVFLVNTGFEVFDEDIGYFRSKFTRADLLSLKSEKEKNAVSVEKTTETVEVKRSYWGINDLYLEEGKFHIKKRRMSFLVPVCRNEDSRFLF